LGGAAGGFQLQLARGRPGTGGRRKDTGRPLSLRGNWPAARRSMAGGCAQQLRGECGRSAGNLGEVPAEGEKTGRAGGKGSRGVRRQLEEQRGAPAAGGAEGRSGCRTSRGTRRRLEEQRGAPAAGGAEGRGGCRASRERRLRGNQLSSRRRGKKVSIRDGRWGAGLSQKKVGRGIFFFIHQDRLL
jgi:hypothetical protein